MKNKATIHKYIIFMFSLIFSISFGMGCGNKTLATYKGGDVTEKELNHVIESMGADEKELQPEIRKQIVKQIALLETLSGKAIEEGLDKTERAQKHFDMLKNRTIRYVLSDKMQKDMEESDETVYRARHILFKVNTTRSVTGKDGQIQKEELSDAEIAQQDLVLYERITNLRKDILSGKVKFEDAASQQSQDPGSKAKGGDLGYFTKGIMVGDFQTTVEYMAGEINGVPARLLVANTNIYTQPDTKSTIKQTVPLNSVVFIDPEYKNDSWKKVVFFKSVGYIPSTTIQVLEKAEDVSYPIRSQYGWHLVQLTDSDSVGKDKFAKLIEKNELDGEENAKETAQRKAEDYWMRVKRIKQQNWQRDSFEKYGVQMEQVTLPKDWKKRDILLDTGSIKVTSKELADQLDFVMKDQYVTEGMIDDNIMEQFYRDFVSGKVFEEIAKEENLYESEQYKNQWEFVKKEKLAELYMRTHWEGDISVSDKEVKDEYEAYTQQMKMRQAQAGGMKIDVEPFNKMREKLAYQIRMRKIRANIDAKQNEFLNSIEFNLNEDAF